MNPPAADVSYCRWALPRVSRTFAANIGVLGGSLHDAVQTAYLLCRTADALEDSWPGSPEAVGERFDAFADALAKRRDAAQPLARDAAALGSTGDDPGKREEIALVAHLPVVLRVFDALAPEDRHTISEAVLLMARGMKRYAVRSARRAIDAGAPPASGEADPAGRRSGESPAAAIGTAYVDTEAELHDYCFIVAGCVGVMLTRLFARRAPAGDAEVEADRLRLAPIFGEALQLTNILLDWPRDVRRGRCYVPAEWLAEYRMTPQDLMDPARAGARAAAKRLESLARAALGQVPEYLDLVPSRQVRYRMFCLWPALWAAASLRAARRDPAFPYGESRPKLERAEVRAIAVRAMLRGHSRAGVRKLFTAIG